MNGLEFSLQSQQGITRGEDSRRQYLTLLAIEPKDGSLTCEIMVSYDRMQAVARRSMGQAKECGLIVPAILTPPVFRWILQLVSSSP